MNIRKYIRAVRPAFCLLGMIAVVAASPCTHSAVAATSPPAMLPAGYLSTQGSRIVDSRGVPVRIACAGGFGAVTDGYRIQYSQGIYNGLKSNIAALKNFGFNCVRVDFNDKCIDDPTMMSQFDQLVAACSDRGIKVIFDHHNNEATMADWGNAAQQTNGLWFDKGPGSNDTDGAENGRHKGTITAQKFQQNWVKLAKHYAGNSTVIGFDLDNEPHIHWGDPSNGENWGEGGPGDIRAMYTNVGNAIQKVDSGALIICEGFSDITDKSSLICWNMDLTHVAAKPVVLRIPNKVVYSVHEYPNCPHDIGPSSVARMNKDWGWLIKKNMAPVWVGEMGASLDKPHSDGVSVAHEKAWADTIIAYMNGKAPGGPRFTGNQQGISGDWWRWGSLPDQTPDGCLTKTGQLNPAQAPYIEQLMFYPKHG